MMLQLKKEGIILDMAATNKDGALQELAEAAANQCRHISQKVLYKALLEREQVGSTGVGNGIAIPHGKIAGLEDITLCFGRSSKGINFEAIDNQPVHLFTLLLSPTTVAAEYLKALAFISRTIKQTANRENLLQVATAEEVIELFQGQLS